MEGTLLTQWLHYHVIEDTLCLEMVQGHVRLLETGNKYQPATKVTKINYFLNVLLTLLPAFEDTDKHIICKQITFVVTCTSLTLTNGAVSYNSHPASVARYPVDTVATFSCNHGYSLSGSTSGTCQTSGNWNQATPTCNQSKLKNI